MADSYTSAALRGYGEDTYTTAALRGFGDDTYTTAALRGCGRGNRLVKGSPEAKARMAHLRSLRGKKSGGAAFNSMGSLFKRSRGKWMIPAELAKAIKKVVAEKKREEIDGGRAIVASEADRRRIMLKLAKELGVESARKTLQKWRSLIPYKLSTKRLPPVREYQLRSRLVK